MIVRRRFYSKMMWSVLLKLLIHARKHAKLSFAVIIPLPQSHINRLCWSGFFRFHSQSPWKKPSSMLSHRTSCVCAKLINILYIYSRSGINSRGKRLCAFKYRMIYVRRLKILHAIVKLNATTYPKTKTHNIHSIISLCLFFFLSLSARARVCCRRLKTPKMLCKFGENSVLFQF